MGKGKETPWSDLEKFVEELLKETEVPGCSVGILAQGEIETKVFGIANIEQGNPVSKETLFQIGSITKTITATAVMKLVEAGKLDLHTPVRTYLPDFKVADEEVSAQVTPYHLLTHTAGWDGDLFIDTGEGDDAIQKYVAKMADRGQIFPLGEFVSYNNAGYSVLGAILEAITGKKLEDLFKEYITEPLGLEKMFFNAGEVISYDFAVGHLSSPEGLKVARPWKLQRCVLPMGAVVTTTKDLLLYAKCYLDGGKSSEGKAIIKPETITDMFSSKYSYSKEDRMGVGLSWWRRDLDQGYIVEHGGGTNGQISQLTLLPEHEFALAIFTNGDKGGEFIVKLQEFILNEFLDVTYELPKEIESTPELLSAFVGTGTRPGFNMYFKMMGDNLVGMDECMIGFPTEKDPPPPPSQPFRIGRCDEDRLIILDGDYKDVVIDIFRDSEGDIKYIRSGRMYQFIPDK
jgi:CubicO group peptidase (beta-lactamase class C family)